MSASPRQHIMWTIWGSRAQPYGAAVAQLRAYLELLRTLHPDFSYWQLLGKKRFENIAGDLSDLEQQLRDAARPKQKDRARYTALDAQYGLTADSLGQTGFRFSLYTSVADARPGMDYGRPDKIELNITIGAREHNGIKLIFPAERADLHQHALMRLLFLASRDFWQADRGEVFSLGMINALEHDRRYAIGILRGTWMTYFRHPLLAECAHDMPCEVEHLSADTLLFTLMARTPDHTNASDVSAARQLQTAFDALHFDHAVTYEGWPHDPEEARYTAQVTGAPADRAYVVAFCAFDGYDAQRKVLLFARLFKLPSHWGTDLLPYYRENLEWRERLPYVVQARQHIAAVRYAGAETPIEWHVGIKATANALKVLLNDWAAIPAEQLRVVYNPMSL